MLSLEMAQAHSDLDSSSRLSRITEGTDTSSSAICHGVLTRTVLDSPVIRWVLPARIRLDSGRDDVLLIGECLIHLREVLDDGSTRNIATKSDLPGRICAARILPSSSYTIRDSLILVLSNHLMLSVNFVVDNLTDQIKFEVVEYPLIASNDLLESQHRLLATSPSSSVVAIAAHQKNITIFHLKAQTRFFATSPGTILVSEKAFLMNCEGVIVRMEFLYPPESTPKDTILAVISRSNGRFQVNIFEWSKGAVVSTNSAVIPFSREQILPSLFIPLKFPGAFLLIDERAINLYTNAHVGDLQQKDCLSSKFHQDVLFGRDFSQVSRSFPCWIGWARSPSSPDSSQGTEDTLYLAREDGLIRYFTVSPDRVGHNGKNFRVASSIDTAFTVLKDYSKECDILVVGGDQCDGYIKVCDDIPLREPLPFEQQTDIADSKPRQLLLNWTPVRSALAVHLNSSRGENIDLAARESRTSKNSMVQRNTQIVTAHGQFPNGRISTLEYGIEIEIEDYALNSADTGIIRLDLVQSISHASGFIVISRPWQSTIAYLGGANMSEECCISEYPTLAVAAITCMRHPESALRGPDQEDLEILVHITCSQVRLSDIKDFASPREGQSYNVEGITAAVIDTENCIVVLTIFRGMSCSIIAKYIYVSESKYDMRDHGRPIEIDTEATCASMIDSLPAMEETTPRTNYPRNSLIAVGTSLGSIVIVCLHPSGELSKIAEYRQRTDLRGSLGACESIVAFKADTSSTDELDAVQYLLLSTHRDGCVCSHLLVFNRNTEKGDLHQLRTFTIGHLPARAERDHANPRSAFLWSGSNICHIDYSNTSMQRPLISKVYFSANDQTSNILSRNLLPASIIDAIVQFPFSETTNSLSSRLFIAFQTLKSTNVAIGRIFKDPRPLSRNFRVPGTPICLKYCEDLESFIVASVSCTKEEATTKRYSIYEIYVIKAAHFFDGAFEQNNLKMEPSLECGVGETITDMLDWKIVVNDQEFLFLVVAVTIDDRRGRKSGCIKFVKAKSDNAGNVSFPKVEESFEKNSVQCICEYGTHSLVYCCGPELKMRTFSTEEKRFQKATLCSLESRGVQISAQMPCIYVTTAEHSVHIYNVEGTSLARLQVVESRARQSLAHLHVPQYNIVLVSGQNGSLSAVPHDCKEVGIKYLEAEVEVTLDSSITSFIMAKIRPLWKSSFDQSGIKGSDILGLCTDGSLFVIKLLSESDMKLLSLVQELYEEHVLRVTKRKYLRKHKAAKNHIDGNKLNRLVNEDGLLEKILQPEDSDGMDLDGPSKNSVTLADLLERTTSYTQHQLNDSTLDSEEDLLDVELIGKVKSYLTNILESPF